MEANREYKDGIIRALFDTPEKLRRLYCDITGKTLPEDAKIEIVNLKNVFLSKRRNDIAFTVDGRLVVIVEHQSTINKNMPLRMLLYVMLFYELEYSKMHDVLYKGKLIKLPKPEFYVLYNGETPYPAEKVQRLSDSFIDLAEGEQPNLEAIVKIFNINHGSSAALLAKNTDLGDYSIFVDKVRAWLHKGCELHEAIAHAVEECLAEGVLTEFLTKYKNEVAAMLSLVYDENRAREVAWEEGQEDGIEKGREEGLGMSTFIIRALHAGVPEEQIAEQYGVPLRRVEELKALLQSLSA